MVERREGERLMMSRERRVAIVRLGVRDRLPPLKLPNAIAELRKTGYGVT
jgi:hypothetical protein